jgi:sugar O-acyltransferase (sialic acid O-acetyltransferase NeuD family)
MNKKILLIGGGGHCKSVLDSLIERNEYVEIGIVDKTENIGKSLFEIPYIGCDDDLQTLFDGGYKYAFVTVGSIGNSSIRQKLFHQLCNIGYEIPTIVDVSAQVSKHATIGPGVFIGKLCIVNAGALIHKGAIINSGSIIEHDSQVGAYAHIASGAVLGGEVVIGDGTHIGANATIRQQIHVGKNSIVGMGSVVLKDLGTGVMAYGNPCEEVKKL